MEKKEKIKTEYITSFLAILLFLVIYGWRCLDVTNTDWLMVGGDLSQHYLGWKFFRFSSWRLPVGMMNTIAYPFSTSILFTDSIPIFAILFKLFSPILPRDFQYFGLWGLLCFVLQGAFGCNILKRYLRSRCAQIAGGLLFVLTPCMIRRMFWHTSLGGQWILLLCLWCLVYQKNKFHELKRSVAVWALIGALSVSIHIYFVPMCGIFLVGFLITDALSYKKAGRVLSILAGFFVAVLFSTWFLGGFGSGMASGAPGLAYYSFNLNGFVNPQEWDCILPEWSNYADGQFEGFSYLGIGILLLILVAVFQQIYRVASGEKLSLEARSCVAVGAGMIFLSMLAGTSNEIAFGSHLLFKIPIMGLVEHIWSIFRSTGRLVWTAVYLLMFFAITNSSGFRNKRSWSCLLILCAFLQMFDILGAAREQALSVREEASYQTLLTDSGWAELDAQKEIEHLIMMDKDNLSQEQLYALADFASDRNVTINDFYFARALTSPIEEVAHDFARHPEEDTIYIFSERSFFECKNYPLYFYSLNGFVVGVKTPIEGCTYIEPYQYATYHMDFNGENIIEGEDRNQVRFLYENGISYGPFLRLDVGTYRVTILGDNLNRAEVSLYSDGGEQVFAYDTVTWKGDRIILDFKIEQAVDDWEVKIENKGAEIKITDISIQYEN